MNKQVLLKLGKVEDIQREKMYRDYLLQLAKKKKAQRKLSISQARLRQVF